MPPARRLIATLALFAMALLPGLPAFADTPTGTSGPPPAAFVGKLFNDLPADHWAFASVKSLINQGIFDGKASLFHPADPVQKVEALAWMMRLGGYASSPGCPPFVDVSCKSADAGYVQSAYRLYIVDGSPGGQFGPGKPVTRQELYSLAVRVLGGRLASENLSHEETQAQLERLSDWPDIASWARGDMAEAMRMGILVPGLDGRLRPQDLATRAEVAVLLNRLFPVGRQQTTIQVDGLRLAYRNAHAVKATAYSSAEPGVGSRAATGLTVRLGMIAVDPQVIPLGSLLYVEGYGYGFAGDTGGAIHGNRVDLYMDTDAATVDAYGYQSHQTYIVTPAQPN